MNGVFKILLLLGFFCTPALGRDPLPSWNCSGPKQAIIQFVEQSTNLNSPHYLPVVQRVAVFDGDGTLWPEQPVPVQLAFTFDELQRLAPEHPEWQNDKRMQLALNSELTQLHVDLQPLLLEWINQTHTGITVEEFQSRVKNWLKSARHPHFDRKYADLAYQPMLELIDYLRCHGFKTYIVSSSGADFTRVWASEVCDLPSELVLGSTGNLRYELRNDQPLLLKEPGITFLEDYAGKPVAIQRAIGRRPVACFGNSDGDQAMLEWTTLGHTPSLGVILHHTDELREFAYDESPDNAAPLKTTLEAAPQRGWAVIDMQRDWKMIFSDQAEPTLAE